MTDLGPLDPPPPLVERIETERLVIRRWEVDDAALLNEAVARNVEHLRPWMPWIKFEPLDVEGRAALINDWTRSWSEGGDIVFGVFLGDSVIGGTGLHRRIGSGGLEIGYWIDEAHCGQGFATELTEGLTTAAFAEPSIERVEIHHDRANATSARVPERLGYVRSGEEPREIVAPGEEGVTVIWRMLPADWADRQAASPAK